MGNCLVTKLKGEVSNPDLLKIGECRCLEIKGQNPYGTILAAAGEQISVSCTSGNMYDFDQNLVTDQGPGQEIYMHFKNPTTGVEEAGDVIISNKYVISGINEVYNLPGDDLLKYSQLSFFLGTLAEKSTDAKWFFNMPFEDRFAINGIFGFYNFESTDLANLRNCTFTRFTTSSNSDAITDEDAFKFEDLGNYLPDTVTQIVVNNYGAKGSIESFVQARRQHIPTGSLDHLYFNGSNTSVTFNGESVTLNLPDNALSWTPTTITFNGVTINA